MFVRNYLSFSIYSATAEHEDEAEWNPNEHCEEAFVFPKGSGLTPFVVSNDFDKSIYCFVRLIRRKDDR